MRNYTSPYRLWLLVAADLALVASVHVRAQEKPGGPTLRTTTRAVIVNAVVTDSQGKPIPDLASRDFSIFDNGHPETVGFFFPTTGEQATPSTSLEGPSVYNNIPAGSPAGATILLFDTLNSRWSSQVYALDRIRKVVRHIEPQDHLGIYVLGQHLEVVHEFTRNASDLMAGIQRYDQLHSNAANKNSARSKKSISVLEQFLAGNDNCVCNEPYDFVGRMTTVALEIIASQMSSVSGRKTLIWVTDRASDPYGWLHPWPGLPSADRLDTDRVIRLMNSAAVAVYPVAAKGLDVEHDSLFEGMVMTKVASRTGGRAFFNRNDLETGIRRAIDDSRYSYELTYYPQHSQWNGKWRELKVRVDRPGVHVLARGGYLALPDP